MTLKSLLFGSAAVLAAGTGAQAADLPTAEPVEYVRICDAFGTGFFYIPGTDTCLRIGGRVRVEAHYVDTFDDDDDDDGDGDGGFDFFDDSERERNNFTTRARGNLSLDARTQTDFGLVRAFLGYEMNVGPSEFGDYAGTSPALNEAFIQISNDFGRFTAGHTASFFDIWGSNTFGTRVGIDDNTGEQTLFGYDFTGGSGFRFGVSLEDPASGDRRFDGETRFDEEDNYEGQELPDLVGFVGIEQGWGTARVSGMVGHIHDKEGFEADEGEDDADELRWALSAGGTADFGLFGFSTQFGYTEGALGYLTNDPGGAGDFEGPDAETNSAWVVRAGISAGFTETVTFNLDGSFTDVEDDDGDDDDGDIGDDFDESYQFWAVAANVVWEPVDGLIMGPEVAYNNLEFDGDDDDDDIDLGDDDDDDDDSQDFWKVMFRIQRDF